MRAAEYCSDGAPCYGESSSPESIRQSNELSSKCWPVSRVDFWVTPEVVSRTDETVVPSPLTTSEAQRWNCDGISAWAWKGTSTPFVYCACGLILMI